MTNDIINTDVPPIGNNAMGGRDLFMSRKYYATMANHSFIWKPIDLWYEKPFYGKVDIYGSPVYPSEAYLKSLPESDSFAINFVADAFTDLRTYILESSNTNKVQIKEMFGNFVPTSGWRSIHSEYHEYFKEIFASYANDFPVLLKTSGTYHPPVTDFESFIKSFLLYCKKMAANYPITKTSYILSQICPSEISGLLISLGDFDHSVDPIKWSKFLSSDAFVDYVDIAAKFGFFVNKNAPWVLMPNFSSKMMKRYMTKHDVFSEDNSVFENFYYKSQTFDYETLKVYLYQSYKSFVAAVPFVRSLEAFSCDTPGADQSVARQVGTKVTHVPLEQIDEDFEEFQKQYDDNFFIKVYFAIRLFESKKNLATATRNKQNRKIKSLLKMSLNQALNYINYYTKQTKIYKMPKWSGEKFTIDYFGEKTSSGFSFVDKDVIMPPDSSAYGSAGTY